MQSRISMSNAVLLLSSTALISFGTALPGAGSANAACLLNSSGNDTYVCDSGTSDGLTDTVGNNTLLLPTGGTGTINGNVTFGGGTDSVEMHSGAIDGDVSQGEGADKFVISNGVVTGNVQQGSGIDDFQMTGGQIGSLNQGDALDTFFMSGGWIVGAFDDGDYAVMTGGRIGRVNLKLDNNYFDMSGGIIDGNLVAGFGNDTIILSEGVIGGNISVSGGTDSVTITGGEVGGDILTSFGEDDFNWSGGGIVKGNIDLGPDNDVATLSDLTDAEIGTTGRISGGPGTDSLTFSNTRTGAIERFDSWETVNLTNGTHLSFDKPLTLGDEGTGTGSLGIDATSTIYGGTANSGVNPFAAGQYVNVKNAGSIDLTNGNTASVHDSFTIVGNYTGQNGLLYIDTTLEGDSAPSDKLVVDGGSISGNTGLLINNAGGGGASTASDGIMVVQSLNGAHASSDAFSLKDRVTAGAYEYFLFKGGVTASTEENWYLRSTLVRGSQPAPIVNNDPERQQPPLPIGDVTPPTPDATPVEGDVVTLYREEVPVYSAIPPVAHHLALSTLGTFHERRGEQDLLRGGGYLPTTWARVFGQDIDMQWKGTVTPGLDGSLYGIQAGQDLFGRETESGHSDRFGLMIGYSRASGDIRGQALGWNNLAVGDMEINGTSFGGYWTHIGPKGWYLDAVLMGIWFGGNATSYAGQGVDIDGHGVTASLEGGYPIALGRRWTLEPQAQIIWQNLSLDDQADRYSGVSFDSDNAWTGRIGLRLQGDEDTSIGKLHPYLKANLWQNFSSHQTVSFGNDPITANLKGTSFEIGGGLTVDITQKASLFATADYTTNIGGEKSRIWEGNVGLNVKW